MAKNRAKKEEIGLALGEKFDRANAAIIAEYKGMTAEDVCQLRKALRPCQAEFKVIKNRLAIKGIDTKAPACASLKPLLKGAIGVTYLYGDIAAGTKKLMEFTKDREQIVVKAAILDGKILGLADVKALAELPPKEVLIARMLGSLQAPHRGLLYVLNGVQTSLVRVLGAIKDKKQ